MDRQVPNPRHALFIGWAKKSLLTRRVARVKGYRLVTGTLVWRQDQQRTAPAGRSTSSVMGCRHAISETWHGFR